MQQGLVQPLVEQNPSQSWLYLTQVSHGKYGLAYQGVIGLVEQVDKFPVELGLQELRHGDVEVGKDSHSLFFGGGINGLEFVKDRLVGV